MSRSFADSWRLKMRYRFLALPLMVLFLAARAYGDDGAPKDLLDAFQKLNKAFVAQDTSAIKRYMADDHVSILSVGVRRTKADDETKLADFKLTAYTTEDVKVVMLGKDAALITFRAIIKGTFKGRPLPE